MEQTGVRLRPRRSRPRDSEATRAAILEAAKAQFAQLGYDTATLRDIASAAGVDVALINRYFGGKDGLFSEALKASFHPDRLQSWNRQTFAREIAEMMAGDAKTGTADSHQFQFLLRAATSPATAPLLNMAVQERFLAPIRDWIGGKDASARARVLAATFIGLLVERLIRDEPLKGQERRIFIDRVAAAFEALLSDAKGASLG